MAQLWKNATQKEITIMKTTRTFLLLAVILTCSNFAIAQTFFVPPLDTGIVTNGARIFNYKTIVRSFSLEYSQQHPDTMEAIWVQRC